ncbi:DUF4355 domain-containing protein [Candidatus Saccharibacteria bacterium]|nr:DUF4355 domain-containing protein [Candidatus Saccharibacteria bacterium]
MDKTVNQNSADTNQAGNTEDKGSNSKTFTQEEVNALLQKRIGEVNAKAEERSKQAAEDAVAEYARKQKMTEEERLNEERKKKDDELAEKERNITLRENRADAIEKLAQLNIDTKLVDFVVDIDADKTAENVTKLSKAFNEAVSKAVEAKLAGKTPADYGNGSKSKDKDKALTNRGYTGQGVIAF